MKSRKYKILIIGAGPIVIGQACEFDYSGTQACKALKARGCEVVLVNSNPATIMTDKDTADQVYIEPLTIECIEKIIAIERPNALLPTLGGQTGLNLGMELNEKGILEKYNVKMLAAGKEVINRAEDRLEFKKVVSEIGLESCISKVAYNMEEAIKIAKEIGYPCVIRPAFTLGGTGGGIVNNEEELQDIVGQGLQDSLISEVLIEESIYGWKEYELEVMRDKNDNAVIVCSIENLDPMGVHTGDSITIAPVQTLTDKEYQKMRDAAIAILRKIGVETGGSNVQFAINPENGRMVVVEMNPRVSRSSALASKATGFPIAKLAAKLALGDTLDVLRNDITKKTPACFEPTIDYVVTKIPRFNFEKFQNDTSRLGTSMRSLGETMAIGRTFKESFQKALRALEVKKYGFGFNKSTIKWTKEEIEIQLEKPNSNRSEAIFQAFEHDFSVKQIHELTKIDYWFLYQFKQIYDFPSQIKNTYDSIYKAKQMGFSDMQLSRILGFENQLAFRKHRINLGIKPVYRLVDTCAGEFEAYTPYYYSTYEEMDEVQVSDKPKVMILGGGPNRIGQGIEFDYCCVHGSMAAKDMGYETIMVNSNPETVSTDFDTSDKLYFEPVTLEDVLNIYEKEQPIGVIVQYGGQTPLNLALSLKKAGVRILGTSPESIDLAEDRDKFKKVLEKLNIKQPKNTIVYNKEEAFEKANAIGFPLVVRPSYVLGGASMEICYTKVDLEKYIDKAIAVHPNQPILLDQFLENAIELDVDVVADEYNCVIAGIMEHVEPCGIHSGDSAAVLPHFSLSDKIISEIKRISLELSRELNILGLMNIQLAVKDDELYMIEVNPRASRTIPFVSKATNQQWAKIATKIMLGATLEELGVEENLKLDMWNIKEAILPFNKFSKTDPVLGPEMKSTGEVMGIDKDFGVAFYKAQMASGIELPLHGKVLILESNIHKIKDEKLAEIYEKEGFEVEMLDAKSDLHEKVSSGEFQLVISIPTKEDAEQYKDVRRLAVRKRIPLITTFRGAQIALKAISSVKDSELKMHSLKKYYKMV
ncbi:carbamoyl-phosphate synthase large subunit [Aureivirga sp. CE67]|uniref:carbamoyl-phosphate synthase large subunit n=1 Tax=Aureivirga sp. CE67 TaxID=1788983 RepID=UPI0018C9F1F0|nr:carbamoyl-phosphate synthase large subunit [Aureivirga sp. CE67]